MKKIQVLYLARYPYEEKKEVQLRATFTNKSRCFKTLPFLVESFNTCRLVDVVGGYSYPFTYQKYVDIQKKSGRVVITDEAGNKLGTIVEADMNCIRNWDADDNGKAIANPAITNISDEDFMAGGDPAIVANTSSQSFGHIEDEEETAAENSAKTPVNSQEADDLPDTISTTPFDESKATTPSETIA